MWRRQLKRAIQFLRGNVEQYHWKRERSKYRGGKHALTLSKNLSFTVIEHNCNRIKIKKCACIFLLNFWSAIFKIVFFYVYKIISPEKNL